MKISEEDDLLGEGISGARCVGRTQNLIEAEQIVSQYEARGIEAKIVKRTRGTLAIYEIWIRIEAAGRTIR